MSAGISVGHDTSMLPRSSPRAASMSTIRTVVADDDADVRSALCAMLDDDPRFTVVAQAASGYDAVAAVIRENPDAALLDIRMPGGGVEAAREIQTAGLPAVLIAVSAKVDAMMVATLLRAGVRGVLVKGRLGRSITDVVARCCAGEVILATPVAAEALKILLNNVGVCSPSETSSRASFSSRNGGPTIDNAIDFPG